MPTVCALNMLQLLLKHTHFGLKGKTYIQIEGTAMGSHLGMNYACTYLGEWEQEFFEIVTAYVRITGDMLLMNGACGDMD